MCQVSYSNEVYADKKIKGTIQQRSWCSDAQTEAEFCKCRKHKWEKEVLVSNSEFLLSSSRKHLLFSTEFVVLFKSWQSYF